MIRAKPVLFTLKIYAAKPLAFFAKKRAGEQHPARWIESQIILPAIQTL